MNENAESAETRIGHIEADLDAAAAAVAEAEARLAAAEEARELAIAAEEERRRREEDVRVEKLRGQLLHYDAQAAEALAQFHDTAAGRAPAPVSDCLALWLVVVMYRTLADNVRAEVLRYDADRAEQVYRVWDQRVGEWQRMLRGATCVPHGGYLPGEEDDAEALAEVNALITEESASAPRPLRRDPADITLPGPAALGVLDPASARMQQNYHSQKYAFVSFATAFDEAVVKRAAEEVRQQIPPRVDASASSVDRSTGAPPRLITRDERVALELEKSLRRGRG